MFGVQVYLNGNSKFAESGVGERLLGVGRRGRAVGCMPVDVDGLTDLDLDIQTRVLCAVR